MIRQLRRAFEYLFGKAFHGPARVAGTPKIGFLPWWPENPYQVELAKELAPRGANVAQIQLDPRGLLTLLLGRDNVDVVHIHWPHGLYFTKYRRFPYVLLHLLCYRLIRNNIVWTVHELEFYETRYPLLDRLMVKFMLGVACTLIAHSDSSAQELRVRYRYRRPIHVIRHPSYVGCYPNEISRASARAELGIAPGQLAYLFLGQIKPYKGVEALIEHFRSLPDPQLALLIVGKPLDEEMAERVKRLAASDARIRLLLGFLPDARVQVYMKAADVAVFPFAQTHTSGSVMLAMSFALPVIAPRLGSIPEYVGSDVGIVYDASSPRGLADALHAARHRDLAAMGAIAYRNMAALNWRDFAREHIAVYESLR